MPRLVALAVLLIGFGFPTATASAAEPDVPHWQRVVLLHDYNTRVVVFGATVLGTAAGLVGSFTLLRKRALMGDALSHATLPGIGIGFIAATVLGADGKSLAVLLPGAAVSGFLGMATILVIRNLTRLKEDAALGIVLSVFFGAGLALLSVVQQMEAGHAAGLEAFILGKTASMSAGDARLIVLSGLFCTVVCALLFKELKLLCFDEAFAGSRGYPVVLVDAALMTLVVIVTIVGLQAVGLVLMIALLVTPAAAARFWTERMLLMSLWSAGLGAGSAFVGTLASALLPDLPSGAMIVLAATAFFGVSMTFGTARGVWPRWLRRRRGNARVDRQHVLRGAFEQLEARGELGVASATVSFDDLLTSRSWSPARLRRAIRRAERNGLVETIDGNTVRLTQSGRREAARLVHEHRLWELFLITHADVAPGRVDRDADRIEHVLEPEMIAELEELLERRRSEDVLRSPHPISISETSEGAN